ncbi:MAG: Flp family type IVb pilin [Chitinophagales bacterium]
MLKSIKRLVTEEQGQGMAEYGLILALIAVAVIVAVTAIGGRLNGVFATVRDALPGGV